MKWFQHDCSARNDLRIKMLKKKHGAVGYAVYFQLLEIIGEQVNEDNLSDWGYVDKLHTIDTLAEECGVAPDDLRAILKTCNDIELFEKKEGRLYCEKILKRLDTYAIQIKRKSGERTSRRSKSSSKKRNFEETSKSVRRNFDKNRLDKIRIDKNRIYDRGKPPVSPPNSAKTQSSPIKKSEAYQRLKKYTVSAILLFAFLLLPLRSYAKEVKVIYTISHPESYKSQVNTGQADRGSGGSPSPKTTRLDKKTWSTAKFDDTELADVPNDEEWQVISKYPHRMIIAKIYKGESTYGRHDKCRELGGYNGFGFMEPAPYRDGPTCFSTFEEVVSKVNDWIDEKVLVHKLDLAQANCLYITGSTRCRWKTSYKLE